MKDDCEELQVEELDEYGNLECCYFGSAVLFNATKHRIVLSNLLVPDAESYEEAVGVSYLNLTDEFDPEEGWSITQLKLEETPVWVDKKDMDDMLFEDDEYDASEEVDTGGGAEEEKPTIQYPA